jgi:hypothetical protein
LPQLQSGEGNTLQTVAKALMPTLDSTSSKRSTLHPPRYSPRPDDGEINISPRPGELISRRRRRRDNSNTIREPDLVREMGLRSMFDQAATQDESKVRHFEHAAE